MDWQTILTILGVIAFVWLMMRGCGGMMARGCGTGGCGMGHRRRGHDPQAERHETSEPRVQTLADKR